MLKRVAVVVVLLCLGLIPCVTADAADARVVFEAGEADAEGYFTLTMRVYDVEFNAFQFALRYDPAVISPTDWTTGEATSSFDSFARQDDGTDWMSSLATRIDAERGLFEFTGYVTPGVWGQTPVNSEGFVEAGADGMALYQFRFKVIGSGSSDLALATQASGEPYNATIPDGGGLVYGGRWVPMIVVYDMPDAFAPAIKETTTGENVYTGGIAGVSSAASTPVVTTVSEAEVVARLQGTVALQIDNYAATINGGVYPIYPGEKTVMPYINNNRTFIPLRFVAESIGAIVAWEDATRTVIISLEGKTLRMPVGSLTYTVDGVEYTMDAAAEIKDNRTMVPIRFVAEALGKAVEWDATCRLVIITETTAPWNLTGETEKEATDDILLVLSPLVRDFAIN